MSNTTTHTTTTCHHCGEACPSQVIRLDDLAFCCSGCKMVYQLLTENGMTAYYQLENTPGVSQLNKTSSTYEFLDDPDVIGKLLTFSEGSTSRITLQLPQIHCSSCLWLLEHIDQLLPGVTSSRVNFRSKEASIQFDNTAVTLRQVCEVLDKIGYAPALQFDKLDNDNGREAVNRRILYQLGLAGFAFGNIMLLSFPEYLGFHQASVKMYVGYINLGLALPVLLYSGIDYLRSAWKGIKIKHLNIDVPVALGMLTLFLRSAYEIISGTGEGYLDSFAGFVFFLLIGKWFQSFTYQALDFDRNYKSYFPISATVKEAGKWITRSIDKLTPGDRLLIKNQELIPADAILMNGRARIDYSFVTGEADLIHKEVKEKVLAGGKQMGGSIEVQVKKKVDQSYLTQLWNEDTFTERHESSSSKLINGISKYFTYVVIVIALATLGYWLMTDMSIAFNAFTAVLIVACPCALALAIPFTYGNILRILSKRGFYLRNVETIESIQDITHVVFDKTGTLTDNSQIELHYHGKELSAREKSLLRSSCMHSAHPLSKAIVSFYGDIPVVEVDNYEDVIGSGLISSIGNARIRVGSSAFIFGTEKKKRERGVFIEIDGAYVGYFSFQHAFRQGIQRLLKSLRKDHKLSMLSGDSPLEAERITTLFGRDADIRFQQSPKDKLDYIKGLQSDGGKVMMIGDGLNDAGALKQSDIGIVVADESNNFSPSCDAVLSAQKFMLLIKYLGYIKTARYVIYGAFILALLYNLIGLSYAITGNLSPVIAAILMPVSSITIVIYGTLMSHGLSRIFTKN